jgi:light-regulated signal transduction histidine kinase (bacteriophytochrome)
MASAHLAVLVETADRNNLLTLTAALGRVGGRIGGSVPPIAALAKDPADLHALVGSGGAVVWRSGRGMQIGQTPPQEALPGLIGWFKGEAAPLITTDRLGQVYAPAREFAAAASGLLALEVSRDTEEYVLWFRPEVLQSINWGGGPSGKPGPNGRLTPRLSFAVWRETVRGRSLPWLPAEVENARQIKELLLAAAPGAAIRLEALLPICAWCKKVRDGEDYWRNVEEFISKFVDVQFTHGLCPGCLDKQIAEFSSYKATHRPRS